MTGVKHSCHTEYVQGLSITFIPEGKINFHNFIYKFGENRTSKPILCHITTFYDHYTSKHPYSFLIRCVQTISRGIAPNTEQNMD